MRIADASLFRWSLNFLPAADVNLKRARLWLQATVSFAAQQMHQRTWRESDEWESL
jgi:hypothetical protein